MTGGKFWLQEPSGRATGVTAGTPTGVDPASWRRVMIEECFRGPLLLNYRLRQDCEARKNTIADSEHWRAVSGLC